MEEPRPLLVQDSLWAWRGEMGRGSGPWGRGGWESRPDWCKAISRPQQKGLDLFVYDLLGRRGRNKMSGSVREGGGGGKPRSYWFKTGGRMSSLALIGAKVGRRGRGRQRRGREEALC